MLAGRHRSGDGVALVLVGPCRHAIEAKGCQSLPSPGRAGSGASLAVPASPRGSGEDLDHLDTAHCKGLEEGKPLDDPGVVGAGLHMALIRCPADAADRVSELALALASRLSPRRAGTKAIDGGDPRRIGHDKVNDLLARQTASEGRDPAIIDDRNVEALPLSAHINADPQSHESSMPHPRYARAPGGRGECSGSWEATSTAAVQRRQGTRPSHRQRTTVLQDCRPLGRTEAPQRSVGGM